MLTLESALRKDRTNAHSTMEHRHFATIAGIIRDMRGEMDKATVDRVQRYFARALRRTNDRFDALRFERACQD